MTSKVDLSSVSVVELYDELRRRGDIVHGLGGDSPAIFAAVEADFPHLSEDELVEIGNAALVEMADGIQKQFDALDEYVAGRWSGDVKAKVMAARQAPKP